MLGKWDASFLKPFSHVPTPGMRQHEDAPHRALKDRIKTQESYDNVISELQPDGSTLRYALKADGTAVVVGCDNPCSSVRVPETLGGAAVTELAGFSLARLAGVTEIVLPDTIRTIGEFAFERCRTLQRLVLPYNVADFDRDWFNGCKRLADLTLPGKLEHYKPERSDVEKLHHLVLGAGLRSLDVTAFSTRSLELVEVDPRNTCFVTDGCAVYADKGRTLVLMVMPVGDYCVPEGCTAIGDRAFSYCAQLEKVVLPSTLDHIGALAFSASGIRSIDVPASVRSIGEKAFLQCGSLSSATLREGLESIGDLAFSGTAVERFALPASLRELGRGALATKCLRAQGAVVIDSDNALLKADGQGVLYRKTSEGLVAQELLNPDAAVVVLDASTTAVAESAFANCRNLARVDLPQGLVSIGGHAFFGCKKLAEASLPDSIRFVGAEAFANTSLTEVRIPAGLQDVGVAAFATSTALALSTGLVNGPTLTSIQVEEGNPVFFTHGGLLYRRNLAALSGLADAGLGAGAGTGLGSGTTVDMSRPANAVSAVQYFGPEAEVSFLPETDVVEMFCLNGMRTVKRLVLHQGLKKLERHSMELGVLPDQLVVEDAACLGTWITFEFPKNSQGKKNYTSALEKGYVDVVGIARNLDECLMMESDPDLRTLKLARRIADGRYLSDVSRHRFVERIAGRLLPAAVYFARGNDLWAFDVLADEGILTADNVNDVVDALSSSGNVEATGYVLEIKRRRLTNGDFWAGFDEEYEL